MKSYEAATTYALAIAEHLGIDETAPLQAIVRSHINLMSPGDPQPYAVQIERSYLDIQRERMRYNQRGLTQAERRQAVADRDVWVSELLTEAAEVLAKRGVLFTTQRRDNLITSLTIK